MRDIKFRAYIKDKNPRVPSEINKIVEVKSLHLGSKKAIIGYSGGNYSIKFDEIELMQYTGLKDKNGKEIYEGDIVLYEDCEMSTENGYGDNFINKGVIEYNDENCCFNVTERITVILEDVLYKDNDSLEVIGNIYDKPELLEKGE